MKQSQGAGEGKPPEFRRFQKAVKKILAVSKAELQVRMDRYNAAKPHRPGPKAKVP